MKRYASILTLITLLLVPQSAFASDWVDNWVDQQTYAGPQTFEGQKRNYATGGSMSLRYKPTRDYPVTVQAPSFRKGCGGIDMFMGSFSYLNADYLENKLTGIVENGLATVAYSLAMSVLSEPIKNTMESLEAIVDRLNQVQLDDCAIAETITASIVDSEDSGDERNTLAKLGQETGISEFYDEVQNSWKGKSTTEARNEVKATAGDDAVDKGCPDELKNFYYKDGTLLGNIAKEIGANEKQIDLLSAFIGDVAMDNDEYVYIEPCEFNDISDIDSIGAGNFKVRGNNGNCEDFTGVNFKGSHYDSFYTWATEMTESLVESLVNKTAIGTAEEDFLNRISSPVFMMIKGDIAASGDIDTAKLHIQRMAQVSALEYSAAMMFDLLRDAQSYIDKAQSVLQNQTGAAAGGGNCVVEIANRLAGHLNALQLRLRATRLNLNQSYQTKLSEMMNSYMLVNSMGASQAKRDGRTQP